MAILFDVPGLDAPLEFRRPRWEDFMMWWDSVGTGSMADAVHNLAISCAVKPSAGEMAVIFDDMGFLSTSIAAELLRCIGMPEEGFAARYPAVAADQVPATLVEATRGKTKRPLYVQTPAGVWALRPPTAGVAGAYTDALGDVARGKPGASQAMAARALVLGCVLSPTLDVATAAIDEYPAIPHVLHGWLQEHGGAGKATARASS